MGWTCVDVAAEIAKRIKKHVIGGVGNDELRKVVTERLQVCYIRREGKGKYDDGRSIGLHSKHFIVDDTCFYIGSQNLYDCDLAEWGVIIDNKRKTHDILDEYWNPLWESSYSEDDCDVDIVMKGLNTDRDISKSKFTTIKEKNDPSLLELQRGYSTRNPEFFLKVKS